MPSVVSTDVSTQLHMSLDDIISKAGARSGAQAARPAPAKAQLDKPNSRDRRGRGMFNVPRGIVKQRSSNFPASTRPKDYDTQQFIKVSLGSDPKTVAGKIAHCARADCPPTVLAIGQGCLNQAIKAVAIARKFCKQPQSDHDAAFDLSCQPAFRENSQPNARIGRDQPASKPSLALYLAKRKPSDFPASADRVEMPVSSATDPSVVAGALAARVREGVEVALSAIGVDAVGNAMRAICFARLYLESDNLDIKAMPEFVHVMKANIPMSSLVFHIVVENAL